VTAFPASEPAYDGQVQVGGKPQTRVLNGATVTKIAVGPYDNNSYLIRCTRSGDALLIDAASQPDRLLELVDGISNLTIATTHGHADHWQALAEVVSATNAETMAGRLDAPDIPVPTSRMLDGGEVVRIGEIEFRTVHLQGHTEGSIVFLFEDGDGRAHVFTGDCLFPGGIGKTWDDPHRFESLYTGVVRELFGVLEDSAWVYPGHGNDTTIGEQRPHLEEWRLRGW
jgi:glyoxylase-like metal-dependent hydrolase (beta-lactamase superfamily II)